MADTFVFDGTFEIPLMIVGKIYHVSPIYIRMREIKPKTIPYINFQLDTKTGRILQTYTHSIFNFSKKMTLDFGNNIYDVIVFNNQIADDILKSFTSEYSIKGKNIDFKEISKKACTNVIESRFREKLTQYNIKPLFEEGIKGNINICNIPDTNGLYFGYSNGYTIWVDYRDLLKKLLAGEWAVLKHIDLSSDTPYTSDVSAIQYVKNASLIVDFDNDSLEVKYQYFDQIVPSVNATVIFYNEKSGCIAVSGNFIWDYYKQIITVNYWDFNNDPYRIIKWGYYKGQINLQPDGFTYWDYLEDKLTPLHEEWDLIAIPTESPKYVNHSSIFTYMKSFSKKDITFQSIEPKFYYVDLVNSTVPDQIIDVICVIPLEIPNVDKLQKSFIEMSRLWVDLKLEGKDLPILVEFEATSENRDLETSFGDIHKNEDRIINRDKDDYESQLLFYKNYPVRYHTNRIAFPYVINRTPKLIKVQEFGLIILETKIDSHKIILEYHIQKHLGIDLSIKELDLIQLQLLIQSDIVTLEYLEHRNKFIATIMSKPLIQIIENNNDLILYTMNHDKIKPYLSCDQFEVFFEQAYKTYYEQFNYLMGYQNSPIDISVFAVTRNYYYCADVHTLPDDYQVMRPVSGYTYSVQSRPHDNGLWWYEKDENGETKWSYNIIDTPIKLDPYFDKVEYNSDDVSVSYNVTLDDFKAWTTYPYQDIHPINCEDNSVNFLYDYIVLSRKVYDFKNDNELLTLDPTIYNVNWLSSTKLRVFSSNVDYISFLYDSLSKYNNFANFITQTDYSLLGSNLIKVNDNTIDIDFYKPANNVRTFYNGSYLALNPVFGYDKLYHTWPIIVIEHFLAPSANPFYIKTNSGYLKAYNNVKFKIYYTVSVIQYDYLTDKFEKKELNRFTAVFDAGYYNYYDQDSINSADESTFVKNGGTYSSISLQDMREALVKFVDATDIRNELNIGDNFYIMIHKYGLPVLDKKSWEDSGDDVPATISHDEETMFDSDLSFLSNYTDDSIEPVYNVTTGAIYYQIPDFIAKKIIDDNGGYTNAFQTARYNVATNTDEIRNRCSKTKFGIKDAYYADPNNTSPTDKDLFGDEISCYGIADVVDEYLENNPSDLPTQIKYDVFALASEASVFCNLSAIKEKIAQYTNNITTMTFDDADNSFREAIINCQDIDNISEAIEKIQEIFPNEVEIDYDGYEFKIFEEERDLVQVRTTHYNFGDIETAHDNIIDKTGYFAIGFSQLPMSFLNSSIDFTNYIQYFANQDVFDPSKTNNLYSLYIEYHYYVQNFRKTYAWHGTYSNYFTIDITNFYSSVNKNTITVYPNSINRETFKSGYIEYYDGPSEIYKHNDTNTYRISYPSGNGANITFNTLDSRNFEKVELPQVGKYRLVYCVKLYKFKIKTKKNVTKSVLKEPCLKDTLRVMNEDIELSHMIAKTTDENGNNYVKYNVDYVLNQYYQSHYYESEKWIFNGIYTVESTMSRDVALKFPLCRMMILYAIMYYLRIPENDIPRFAALMIDASKFRVQMREDLQDQFDVIAFLKWAFNNVDLFTHYGISQITADVLFTTYNTNDQYYVLFQIVRLIDFYEKNCNEIICGQIEQLGTRTNVDSQDSNLIGTMEVFKNNITDKIVNAKAIDINEINRIYKAKNYDIKFHKPTGLYVTSPYHHLLYKVINGLNTIYVDYSEYDIREADWYIVIKMPEFPSDDTKFIVERDQPTAGIYVLQSIDIKTIIEHSIISFDTPKTHSKVQYELYQQGIIDVELKELPYGYKILEMGIPVVIFKLPLSNTNLIREIHAQTIPSRAVNQTRFKQDLVYLNILNLKVQVINLLLLKIN